MTWYWAVSSVQTGLNVWLMNGVIFGRINDFGRTSSIYEPLKHFRYFGISGRGSTKGFQKVVSE